MVHINIWNHVAACPSTPVQDKMFEAAAAVNLQEDLYFQRRVSAVASLTKLCVCDENPTRAVSVCASAVDAFVTSDGTYITRVDPVINRCVFTSFKWK